MKTQKWYYFCNMISAYFPINRILHRERERQKERERCEMVKTQEQYYLCIRDLHISLSIGDYLERKRERERARERGTEIVREIER